MDKYLCERCGKELVFRCAYSRIDHKLICVECDDKEQPKELMKKIQELETKLKESEKAFDTICSKYEKKSKQIFEIIKRQEECSDAYDLLSKENDQLKQQIADKDQAIESLQEINQSLGQTCNNDAKEIERLREQLSDKDKEIEDLNKFMSDKANEIEDLKERISNKITSAYGAELMAKDVQWHLEKEIQELKQSQTQTAIKELQKLLDKAQTLDVMVQSGHYINQKKVNVVFKDVIDQQITKLKGKK